MYLKNISTNTSAVVNTKVGKICVKPGEVICLKEKVFSPLPRSLRQVSEEEYLNFRNPDTTVEKTLEERANELLDGDNESDKIMEETIKDADLKIKAIDAIKTELPEDNITAEDLDNAIQKVSQDIKDEGTLDFIKSLLNLNMFGDKEVIIEEEKPKEKDEQEEEKPKEKEALKVQKTTNETEKELLEQQIDDLKKSWEKAKQPRKKERIYKEIQELQKQIDKL